MPYPAGTSQVQLRPDSGTLKILKGSDMARHALDSLPESDDIVLFSPVIKPPAWADEGSDPFEPLGRALSRYHRRIRHTPYRTASGLKRTHEILLEGASIIIVAMVCETIEPQMSTDVPSPRSDPGEAPSSPAAQLELADEARELFLRVAQDTKPQKPLTVLLLVGKGIATTTADSRALRFDTILHCPVFTEDLLSRTADVLFNPDDVITTKRSAGKNETQNTRATLHQQCGERLVLRGKGAKEVRGSQDSQDNSSV